MGMGQESGNSFTSSYSKRHLNWPPAGHSSQYYARARPPVCPTICASACPSHSPHSCTHGQIRSNGLARRADVLPTGSQFVRPVRSTSSRSLIYTSESSRWFPTNSAISACMLVRVCSATLVDRRQHLDLPLCK